MNNNNENLYNYIFSFLLGVLVVICFVYTFQPRYVVIKNGNKPK